MDHNSVTPCETQIAAIRASWIAGPDNFPARTIRSNPARWSFDSPISREVGAFSHSRNCSNARSTGVGGE